MTPITLPESPVGRHRDDYVVHYVLDHVVTDHGTRERPAPHSGTGLPVSSNLLRRHADRAVEPDDLTVEHRVLEDVADERGEFGRLSQARRVWHLRAQ